MAFIRLSMFIIVYPTQWLRGYTWSDYDLIAQVLGLPTSEVPSAETLRSAYRDLAKGSFFWGAWTGWRSVG